MLFSQHRSLVAGALWASVCGLSSLTVGCFSNLEEELGGSPSISDETDSAATDAPGETDEGETDAGTDTEPAESDQTEETDPPADGGTPIEGEDVGAGPRIIDTSPAVGASAVSPDTNVSITFDRGITAGEGSIRLHEGITRAEVEVAPIDDARVSIDDDTLVVNWDGTLSPSTGYYILLDPGAVRDADGNSFVGLTSPEQFSFNTRIPQDLELVATVPDDGDTNVPRTRSLRFTFNEPIIAGLEGNITIIDADTSETFETIPVTDELRVGIDAERMTVDPSGVFSYGTRYLVTVDSGTVQSTGGATFAGLSDEQALSFTTVLPPDLELVGTVPADDATEVDPASSLVLTFAEPVLPGEGSISVHRTADDSVVEVATVGDANVVVSGITLSVDLLADLETSTSYYVTVDTGVVESELGAPFAGIVDPETFSFTTAAAAITPLELLLTTPAPGEDDVPLSTELTLAFSEDVTVGSGVISVFAHDSDTLVDTIDVTSASQVSVSGDTVDVILGAPLEGSTQYYVTVTAGTFRSSMGASFAGISGNEAWSFTTEVVFGLAEVQPNDDAVGVNPATHLVMTFTEDVIVGSGDVEIRAASDNSVIESVAIGSSKVTVDGATLTVNLDSILGSEVPYYVLVDGSAVSASGGDGWGGITDSTRWNFTTSAVDFPAGTGSGLVLWLDAVYTQSIKESGGGVTLWADRSGRYRNVTQAASAARPVRTTGAINGNAVIRFDGEDQLDAAGGINLAAYDGFIVWQSPLAIGSANKSSMLANDRNTEINHSHPFEAGRNATASCIGDGCPEDNGWYTTRFVPTPVADQPTLWNWGFDAITTTLYARTNGSAPINNTGPTAVPWLPESPLLIGNCTLDPCGFTGDIGEIVLYSRTLTPAERAATISYLRNKWGFSPPSCGSGEVLGPNGSCYFLGTDEVNWDTARSNCQNRGTGWDLATIRSSVDHDFVATLLMDETAIGATDSAVEGIWRWATDTLQFWSGDDTGMATNSAYTAWLSGDPSAAPNEDCARYLQSSGNWVWADYNCADVHDYLCEGPAD